MFGKKLLFLTCLASFSFASAQLREVPAPWQFAGQGGKSDILKAAKSGGNKSTPCGIDTLYYSRYNNTYFTPRYITAPGGAGMFFSVDDTVWLYGFNFFAYAYDPNFFFTSQSVNCKVYYANANRLPAGLALATKAHTIVSSGTSVNQLRQTFLFNNPIMLVANFVVTFEVPGTSNTVVIASNDYYDNNGFGNNYSCVKLGNNWANNLVINTPTDTVPFDADFFFEPIVEYKMSAEFDHGPNSCLGNGKIFDFINTTTFATNPLYSKEKLDTTLDDNFVWDYGDGSPLDTMLDGSHFYASAAGFWVYLYGSFTNWVGNTCLDDTMSFLEKGDVEADFASSPNGLMVTFTDKSKGATSWSWNFGDGPSGSIQKNPTHIYSQYGLYGVKQKARNKGCVDSFIYWIVLIDYSVVDELRKKGLIADFSPNPADDEIQVKSVVNKDETGQWRIYNIQGVEVKSGKLEGNFTISVSDVPSGVYFISFEASSAIQTRRLVVR